jgi:centromere protein J
MSFSPADSLESNMTLVSAAVPTGTRSISTATPTAAVTLISSVERDGKNPAVEKTYSDGSVEVCYANGNRKSVSADGRNVRVFYYNGDVKESALPNGIVKYFYSQTKTWHLTYQDKREVLQFEK